MKVSIGTNNQNLVVKVKSMKHACRVAAALADAPAYRIDQDELNYFIRVAPCTTLATVSKMKVK